MVRSSAEIATRRGELRDKKCLGGGSVTAQPVQATYAPPVAQGTVVSGGKNDPPPAYGGPVAAEMARS